MTIEQCIEIFKELWRYKESDKYSEKKIREALDLAIKALEQCEVWNGSHGQIVAPKGTFERIYNDCKDEQPNYLKKRDGNYVHYNVEWLLKNWQMELDILSDGKIKLCEDCISRADVLALAEKGTLVSNGNYKSVCKAIKALPSVMPKALEQTGGDCISREAVLDIINFEDEWLFDAKSHNADTKIAFSTIKSKISEMPSVTPTYDLEEYSTKLWKLAYERGKAEGEQRNG